jgi:hypothetical protein
VLENVGIDAWHRVEEILTPDILHAWNLTLQFIEVLGPTKIIASHIEKGWDFDAKADLEHMHRYLDLFASKITNVPEKANSGRFALEF